MPIRHLPLLAVLLALIITGCSEDDGPATPPADTFVVTVAVIDMDAQPVVGLQLNVLNDHPYMQKSAAAGSRASVAIGFDIPAECRLEITILDVEDTPVRTMWDAVAAAGSYLLNWDGKNDSNEHQHAGVYRVRMTARNATTGAELWQDQADMLMSIAAPAVSTTGVTDAEGMVRLTDRRLFPQTYDLSPISVTNEFGLVVAYLNLTEAMLFRFEDPATDDVQWLPGDVGESGGMLAFVWDPDAKTEPAPAAPAPKQKVQLDPPAEFALHPPYPNPFN